jgi:heat shock protein HtpX
MVGEAFGLYSHIRRNRIRSWFLIAGLFLLAYLVVGALSLVFVGTGGGRIEDAVAIFLGAFPFATVGVVIWILVGYRINVWMIGAITGAEPVTRESEPALYRMMENLCIARGLTMPKLAIVDSPALNAFASGVNEKQFTVTVTRGLLNTLTEPEIEAVLAHELTHIRNGDVRLMIIAVLIVGIISFVAELVFRGGIRGGLRGKSSDSKGGGAAILIGIAILAFAWLVGSLVRFSLSRSREYLADAGAVELTKNPDAMISALLKISGRADIEGVPSGVMDMCFENDPDGMMDLFATHPSIPKRVQALVTMAGGRMPPKLPKVEDRPDLPGMVESHGPWTPRPPQAPFQGP